MTDPAEPLHRQLALTDEEYAKIVETLDREPNRAELAMYSVMWSEHCSYKSSKIHLRRLPTEGEAILVGPGEDAGVVDVGDGVAVVFKLESHNHPSAIEPVQGAATGVGGIVRDVLSMGARPIAILDSLRFGPLDDPRNRWLLGGVVTGIGQYGNSIGVANVGGEVGFAPCYSGNPLVNAMCIGVAQADRLLRARAEGAGNLLVLIGSRTGRDGIGGVSVLASRPLEEGDDRRPSVQIGDPFYEKLCIEACLQLADAGLLLGLQDLGGAGITCAVSESAARADAGAELDLEAIPLREEGMEPFEILTSESQERMLAIVRPEDLAAATAVCDRWGLASAVIGKVTTDRRLRVIRRGQVLVDVPARSLADDGPTYHRPMEMPAWIDDLQADDPTFADAPDSVGEAFLQVLGAPNVAGKQWVFEQYDSLVQHNTVQGPGGDAAVIRLEDGLRAIAVSTDGNGRFAYLDPYLGASHAAAEAARNVACVGARPLAVTNCLNFGNPERPEVMWQFAEAVKGLGDACRALGTPVTGGNVSFYNETSEGTAIYPTPVVGMLGVIEDYRLALRSGFPRAGLAVYLLGETLPELGGSEYAATVLGRVSGRPPELDLEKERRLIRLLADAARQDIPASAHDCSEGGLAVALAEAAIAGGTGFAVSLRGDLPAHVELFSESASRAVVSVDPAKVEAFEALCGFHQVTFERIGETGGPRLVFGDAFEVPLAEAAVVHESAIPNALAPRAAAG